MKKKAINRYRSRQASRLAIGGYKLSSLVIGGGRTAQSGPWPPGCTAPFEPREVQSAAFPLPVGADDDRKLGLGASGALA